MAKSKSTERDEKRELTRRALIKWSIAAGAALGVSRTRVFEILDARGVAIAEASAATCNSVHVVAGNGGAAWFQLLWPHYAVAQQGVNGVSALHLPATAVGGTRNLYANTDTPFMGTVGTDPWALPPELQVTAFMCGQNETHTTTPTSTISINGNSLFAMANALQLEGPSVIPVITIDDATAGIAPGAPTAANVGSADDIVGLFNSAASRAGGILARTQEADLYNAHFEAFSQIHRSSALSTFKSPRATAKVAAKFLGTNLSAALSIQPADLARYGVDTGGRVTPNKVKDLAKALIVTAKAFKLGLTRSVIIPAFRDDPHGAFDGGTGAQVNSIPSMIRDALNGFMADLRAQDMHNNTVMTFQGDTTKNPNDQSGWPDGTPNNSNTMWVAGAGYLKSGWFGKVNTNATAQGWDPNTGAEVNYNATNTARQANAAVAYAIAKADSRAISAFANGIALTAATVPVTSG